MSRTNWNLFGKIWIQNVGEILISLAAEISNKFQKNQFWKEKLVEDLDI